MTVAVSFHGAAVPSQDSSGARGNAKPTSVARPGACTSMLGTTRLAGQRPRPQPDPIITATERCWRNVLKTALSARKRSCRADRPGRRADVGHAADAFTHGDSRDRPIADCSDLTIVPTWTWMGLPGKGSAVSGPEQSRPINEGHEGVARLVAAGCRSTGGEHVWASLDVGVAYLLVEPTAT